MGKILLLASMAVLGLSGLAQAGEYSRSLVPGYPDVAAEYVQIAGHPAPGTPKPLNTATFLRLRAAPDGDQPRPANAVIVALPGFSSTPPHWLYLASQLVHKAQDKTCDGAPCRVEVWVLQRRGANLAETTALTAARKAGSPKLALDYYLGPDAIQAPAQTGRPGQVGPATAKASWKPLTQTDLAFMSDWGFETYSGDVDQMIGLISEKAGAHTLFLAGHSQGGGFVSNYAARLQPNGQRGIARLSGLIFLDGGPSAGTQPAPTAADLEAYMAHVSELKSGKAPVYTDANGLLGAIAGPASAVSQSVTGIYYAFSDPKAESIFPLRVTGMSPAPGDSFLKSVRMTWLARAGTSFDTDPVPEGGLQIPVLQFLGEGLGRLDFQPMPGSETACDRTPAAPLPPGPARAMMGAPPKCVPSADMVDPNKVYDWIEGGGHGLTTDAGKASLWLKAQAFAPARSNIKPVKIAFAQSGPRTIDAADMVASNWYASERWDYDAAFVGRFKRLVIDQGGMKLDVDKSVIANIPVYVARQGFTAGVGGNPFPGVTDYTEVNKTGTWQTDAAKAVTPFNPRINVAILHHTDFVSADDSTPDQGLPGEAGNSAVANTLIDWVLKRSKGTAITPLPAALGVRTRY